MAGLPGRKLDAEDKEIIKLLRQRGFDNWMGKTVIARTAGGDEHGTGLVVNFIASPTLVIERSDGFRFSWPVTACEVVSDDS